MTREEASYILRRFYANGYKSNDYNTLEQALQFAVMCLENFPHWISVEDELPKEKGWIIVSTFFNSVACPAYYYEGEDVEVLRSEGITHWMYFPSVEYLKDK